LNAQGNSKPTEESAVTQTRAFFGKMYILHCLEDGPTFRGRWQES
jgi:hypothetical protein